MALALLMLLLHLGGPAVFEPLAYHRESIVEGQWWRVLTGHLVHWSGYHLLLNVSGLMVWILLCPMRWTRLEWCGVMVSLGAAVSLWLFLVQPQMLRYAGFSGVLHGLFLLGLASHAVQRDLIAGLCLLYLVGKIVWEQAFGASVSDAERIGAAVATDAHLAGSIGAALLLVWGYYRQRNKAVSGAGQVGR